MTDDRKELLEYLMFHTKAILSKYSSIKEAIDELDTMFQDRYIPIELTNYLKSVVQKEALNAWINNNFNGIIVLPTGTGKSRIPIKYLYDYGDIGHLNMIVVPTEKLRDNNWKEEFIKFDTEFIYKFVQMKCYASLNKQSELYDLIVLDEIHNITPNNAIFKAKHVMGLTATKPTDSIKCKLLEDLDLPIVYELTLDEAIKLRLIAPYEITVIETELDNNIKYLKSGNSKNKFNVTEKQAYEYINSKINALEPRINNKSKEEQKGYGFHSDDDINRPLTEKEQKMLNNLIMKRMKFIYGLESKTQIGRYLTKQLHPNYTKPNPRTLIFCGTIEQAEKVCIYQYHSKTDDFNLNNFIIGEIDILSCVNALNEGINIPDIDYGVIIQLNSNELHLVQRLGRICRAREGHVAKIIIVVVKGTIDEKWVNNAISGLDNTKIKRINYSHLKVGIETI